MLLNEKSCFDTLAIIGNGFDLAHNLNTDYESFAKNTKNENLDIFRELCFNDAEIKTWYYFEENIRIIAQKIQQQSIFDDYDKNRAEVSKIKKVFKGIHKALIDYLRKEIKKPIIKNNNIANCLTDNVFAINFNYTNTAEYYTNNIYYVHGSLDENDIILGYDEPNFACLAQFDDIYWSKSICREMLAFRRLLKKDNSNYGDEKTKELIDSLEKYLNYENSGRGIDDEVKDLIPNYDFISNFHNDEINTFVIKDIDFNNIKKIVVIGHGIEADRTFLEDMLKKCINLREVEIFKYENEPDESIDRKIKFFLEYCQNITLKAY